MLMCHIHSRIACELYQPPPSPYPKQWTDMPYFKSGQRQVQNDHRLLAHRSSDVPLIQPHACPSADSAQPKTSQIYAAQP